MGNLALHSFKGGRNMGFDMTHQAEQAVRQHLMREAHKRAVDNAKPGDARQFRNLKLVTSCSALAIGTANAKSS